MDESTAWRTEAQTIPPLTIGEKQYPVDVEATVASGWVTYNTVEDEGQAMDSDAIQDQDTILDTKLRESDVALNAEFGTLDDLMSTRPSMSELYIPEVQKKFYIRTLTGQEVDAYRSSIIVGKGQNQTVNQRGMRAKLIVLSLGNPDGSRMLTDKDTSVVQQWPSKILERIFDRSRKFNGLTDEDTDDEKGNS